MDTMSIVIIVFLGLGLISAPFIYFKVSLEKKEELAKTISILGGFIAALSLFWAAYTYSDSAHRQSKLAEDSAKLQRELAASSLYREHMTKSLEESSRMLLGTSELARKEPPTEKSPLEEQNIYERYKWYVGHALFSFESILEVSPDDDAWKDTFEGFICDHKTYIGSDQFQCERYTQKIRLFSK